MGYLVTHIAACLVFAQLLGLLLGWLLWGYVARQRGVELLTLRERLADLNLTTRRMAFAGEPRVSLEAPPESIKRPALSAEVPATELPDTRPARRGPLVEDDLPMPGSTAGRFFMLDDQTEEPGMETAEPLEQFEPVAAKAPPVAPDLEAEVREARLQHFEQQVRELEGMRDRLPLLQADLSEAIAGRRAAESKVEETKSHYEVRVSNLLSQVRDFERAAGEWDRIRSELERSQILKDKELSSVKAHLRDLQNNQLPQKADPSPPPGMSLREIADLRERYQKAVTERDAIASELETWKQSGGNSYGDSVRLTARLAELEEALRTKDAHLEEQLATTESLLWRVAELEPFALAAPRQEEDLRRLESEIAGHVAMHSESSDHIRTLLNRVGELETATANAAQLRNELNERDAAIERLVEEHAGKLEWKDREIAQHIAAREEQASIVAGLEVRITSLEAEVQRVVDMERALTARDAEIEKLQATEAEAQHELQGWKELAGQLEPLVAKIPELQESLSRKDLQLGELLKTSADTFVDLEAWRNRALELEPLTDRVSTLEQSVKEKDAEIQALLRAHADTRRDLQNSQERIAQLAQWEAKVPELEQSATAKDAEIQALLSALADTQRDLQNSQERIAQLVQWEARVPELEQSAKAKDAEIQALLSAHADMRKDLGDSQERIAHLAQFESRVPVLEQVIDAHAQEVEQLKNSLIDKDGQLTFLSERLSALTERLSASQHRLTELEPLAAKLPETEQQMARQQEESSLQMKAIEDRHRTELTRLKVNAAQRVRRLRQSLTNL